MDAKGPTAKPEDAEDYLRNLGAKRLGRVARRRGPAAQRNRRRPARPQDREPEAEPRPEAQARPNCATPKVILDATPRWSR